MRVDMRFECSQQYVLNDRWLFSFMQETLVDLDGHMPVTVVKPVVARMLVVLAHSPNMVLHRQRLLDEGWRAFGFEVCENSLNQVICSLRKTFEVLEPGRVFIRTIPRIGYCLLANVQTVAAEVSSQYQGSCCTRLTGGAATSTSRACVVRQLTGH